MKFENTTVMNFENSLHGMRNPKNSWNKSDSYFGIIDTHSSDVCANIAVAQAWVSSRCPSLDPTSAVYITELTSVERWLEKTGVLDKKNDYAIIADIGPADMKLAQTLIQSGPEHRKFLRQIFVSVDITAPLYWWKEADTYKVGTVSNSTSTMHKLASTPITKECFEIDDYKSDLVLDSEEDGATGGEMLWTIDDELDCMIEFLENLRQKYQKTKDTRYWKELVRWLPESWLQTRTWTCNYENIRTICHQREGHKLTEWRQFIDWAETLPYNDEFIFFNL